MNTRKPSRPNCRPLPPDAPQWVRDELSRVEHMSRAMNMILGALDPSLARPALREIDVTCPLCGGREVRMSRDPNAPGAVMAVCSACAGM